MLLRSLFGLFSLVSYSFSRRRLIMKNGKVFVDIVYCIFFSVLLTENFTELFHLSKKEKRSWDCIWMKNMQTCVNLKTIAKKYNYVNKISNNCWHLCILSMPFICSTRTMDKNHNFSENVFFHKVHIKKSPSLVWDDLFWYKFEMP